ncbi:hypothetical protein DFH09DRAFT_989514 [Mycena vulgaris]|nr:hypothetical protein DFH09DRAFT_989514 [Mycena vulgaris]
MTYVRPRKFCCCLPVRVGVFVMSILALIGGGIVSVVSWMQVSHLKDHPLSKTDEIALYITAAVFTILTLIGGLGFIGVSSRNAGLVSLFGGMLNIHLVFNIVSGAFAIYSLFKGPDSTLINTDAMDTCLKGATDQSTIDTCKTALNVAKGIVVGGYVLSWAIELYGCIIVHNYVKQLHEEHDAEERGTSLVSMAGANPVPAYASTDSIQSYGKKF